MAVARLTVAVSHTVDTPSHYALTVIDLHLHSHFSDGSDAPERLAELAVRARLSAVALTDHDSTNGYAEMAAACAARGVELVAGAEVSVKDRDVVRADGRTVSAHVLVYFPSLDDQSPVQVLMAQLRRDRSQRNRRLVDLLVEQGFTRLTIAHVIDLARGEDSVGRPHFADAMMTLHPEIVGEPSERTRQRIFDEWLGAEGKAYIPKTDVSLTDLVTAIQGSGAVLSVAHPILNYLAGQGDVPTIQRQLPAILEGLRTRGVRGVECYYGQTPQPIRDLMVRLTRDAGLIPTGGSDYHGAYKPDVAFGRGRTGDLMVPDSVLDELKAASQSNGA